MLDLLSPPNRTTSNSPPKQILSRKSRSCMAAMSSLGRLGLSSRRGLILISNSKSSMLRSEPFMRGLATTVRRDERFFTKKHEWVEVEGTKGTVGISKYAADALGDVVYAQLPEPGDTLAAGDECGALESVKAASEVYCPVSGAVTEKNVVVEDGPALINQSAEDEGWLFKLDLSAAGEVSELMDNAAYEVYLKECEEH